MSEPLQIEDSLIYRLTDPDGVNCDEINVTMWQGSRNHRPRTAGARRVLACIDACAGVTTDDLEKYGFLAMRTKQVAELERQRDDLIAALKEARSVVSSVNAGARHKLVVNDEPVFWQREEWVRWALDEVLPMVDAAIADCGAEAMTPAREAQV